MGIKRERQREIRIKEMMRKTHRRDRAGWRRNNEAFAGTKNMDTLGFEPRAFRMRNRCDTTTPCAHLIASQEHTAIWQKNEKGVHECKPEEERERERERERDRGRKDAIEVVEYLPWKSRCGNGRKNQCRDPGSNRGPSDLQSDALPTEL